MKIFKRHPRSTGQALVEFAIIAVGLLMLIFLIIEAARILWAWGTVQNAARAGARYAITGNYEIDCATQDIPKYADLCASFDTYRPASVINEAHRTLTGLPLNENINSVFEDTEFYSIEIYGVDQIGQLKGTNLPAPYGPAPFAGSPNKPVIVRVLYRVPIITPFFSPILPSIPVFGQTTLYNEPFGQLGGTGESAGAPPPIPAIPTAGVTPSFTPTQTPGPTATATLTPTLPAPPTIPPCPIRWTSSLVVDVGLASVTGLYDNPAGGNYQVLFYNLNLDPGLASPIGITTMMEETGGVHACPGIGNTTLTFTSANIGHTIRVVHPDGSSADIIVQGEADTPTPTPTQTATATVGPTETGTPTPTNTPTGPFISVLPRTCAVAPNAEIFVTGANWPPNDTISIFINSNLRQTILPFEHEGAFSESWLQPVVNGQTYQIVVVGSSGAQDTHSFIVPCPNITPTPILATATNTPIPADLTIGQPVLISTPPIVEYRPVQFRVPITNVGQVDVNSQFFVDIFIDPPTVYPEYIPIPPNPAYSAIGSIPGGGSKVITITSEIGFTGGASLRQVYSMVDSLRTVSESDETNNIAYLADVTVIPADTPEPTATPDGFNTISGRVRFPSSNYPPQNRARVYLINNDTANTVSYVQTDGFGNFSFNNISMNTGGYKVVACFDLEGAAFYENSNPVIYPPNSFAFIFLVPSQTACSASN